MQIEIPEPLLKRLQKDAIPFIDTTPLSVIERWADFYDQYNKQKSELSVPKNGSKHPLTDIPHGVRQFDPKRPPSLLHTRVRGEFDKTSFSNWNDMLRIAHIYTFKEAGSFDELRKITRAQIRKGSYSDEGYKFVPEIGVSIQGVDASHAWEYALRLAIHLKIPLKAEIEWRHNDNAAHPGERGIMVWTP
ncbi:MAG TPA: hypothetical protein VE344_00925 [Methylomirabilota bacterium]|nr:hypothetical protein [Methylomirabilota bacterium]